MKILCVMGEHAYGDPSRGEGVEHANFLPALRRLGHHVTFFESFSREPYASFAELNRALLKRVEETAPDVVFCVLMQYEVWIETIRLIRSSGISIINWSTDDSWKYSMFSRLIGREFDRYVTTYPELVDRYHRDGIGTVYVSQWAANAETLAPPVAAALCRYEVSFVGAAYGKRPAMIEKLRQEGIDVACFGHGWPEGTVEAKRVGEIVRASQVSLNFSEGAHGNTQGVSGRQIKARVFEVPGYGGCLLTERAPNLERYFRLGEEIRSFEGEDELVREVKTLLASPDHRDQVAQKGFARVRREHTYDRRFDDMLKELTERVKNRSRVPIGWSLFEVVADGHRLSPMLKMVRSLLINVGSIIWGRQRGPRAARRLAFELSWRLRGAWTYRAAGWPGRLFYRES
ncbi:MAG TPA: glycosyltransferase [Nitrospira sp.]|nr:glycosyltransferase [Nitrospira sp.]